MQRDLLILAECLLTFKCLTIGELTETQQVTNLLHVRYVNDGRTYQVALLLLGLLRQNVTVVSVVSLDLTCTRERESLLRTGICLYFWHCFNYLNCYYKSATTHIPGAPPYFLITFDLRP